MIYFSSLPLAGRAGVGVGKPLKNLLRTPLFNAVATPARSQALATSPQGEV